MPSLLPARPTGTVRKPALKGTAAKMERLILGDNQIAVGQYLDVDVKTLPVEGLGLGICSRGQPGSRRKEDGGQKEQGKGGQETRVATVHERMHSMMVADLVHTRPASL
jgi:hypothetical protein